MIRGGIIHLLKIPSSPSLLDWCKVLTYYTDNKNELNWLEVHLLRCQSEWYRIYFNKNRIEQKTIYRTGKYVETSLTRPGLGIRREDVNPDISQDCITKSKLLKGATIIITAAVALAIRLAGFRMARDKLLTSN